MQVNAHGRRWPNAGRFGLFGAIVNRLREVFWGVERDDLEMILFTLHPFYAERFRGSPFDLLNCARHSYVFVPSLW